MANTYAAWARFMRKWAPPPGDYKCAVHSVRGTEVYLTIQAKRGIKKVIIPIKGQLWYNKEMYNDLPREEDADIGVR